MIGNIETRLLSFGYFQIFTYLVIYDHFREVTKMIEYIDLLCVVKK